MFSVGIVRHVRHRLLPASPGAHRQHRMHRTRNVSEGEQADLACSADGGPVSASSIDPSTYGHIAISSSSVSGTAYVSVLAGDRGTAWRVQRRRLRGIG